MTWKDILKNEEKAHCGTEKIDEKMLYGEQKKLDKDKDGKITGKDFAMLRNKKVAKQDIEAKILAEIKKEGGALGMKNLKQFGEESEIKRALSKLQKEGKVFIHRDGDIYTHKPSSKRRGPFTA